MPSLSDRGPLKILFIITSMPVGGAEVLLMNLVRRMDRTKFAPEICCLKEMGPLGEELSAEIPVHHDLIGWKWDPTIPFRLASLMRERKIDAVVTVGAGDKMFWGRLGAWWAGVPVITSALHSTGWPDGVGTFNRWLTGITDAFIGCASEHGRFLIDEERFPENKVYVIPNGVDTDRFVARPSANLRLRAELGIASSAPVCGIVAALRPEKNHELFLRMAAQVSQRVPEAVFLIVGDGPERPALEALTAELKLGDSVRFLGTRSDVAELLSVLNVFALTSHMEANPVSILEAMATEVPVVAPRVGSIPESVREGKTGYLYEVGQLDPLVDQVARLLGDPLLAKAMGECGRYRVVEEWSLDRMVDGYEQLLEGLFCAKTGLEPHGKSGGKRPAESPAAASPR